MINVNAMMNIAAVNAKTIGQAQNTSKRDAFSNEMENAVQKQSPKHAQKTGSPQKRNRDVDPQDASSGKMEELQAQTQGTDGMIQPPVIGVMNLDPVITQEADTTGIIDSKTTALFAEAPKTGGPLLMQNVPTLEQTGQSAQSVYPAQSEQPAQSVYPVQSVYTTVKSKQPALQSGQYPLQAVPFNEQVAASDLQGLPQQTDKLGIQQADQSSQLQNKQVNGIGTELLAQVLRVSVDTADTSEPIHQPTVTNEQAQPNLEGIGLKQTTPGGNEQGGEPNADAQSLFAKELAAAKTMTRPGQLEALSPDDGAAAAVKPKLDADEAPPVEIKLSIRSAADLQTPQIKQAVAAKVVESIETLVQTKNNHIRIQMQPDVLGGMTIKLNLVHDGIRVQLLTTGKATHALVNDQIVQLKEALSERGIQVQQIEVIDQSKPGASDGFAQPFFHQEQEQQNHPNWMPAHSPAFKEDTSDISALYESMVPIEGVTGTVEFSA